ncbi:MAG: chemotaxis protein CheR [Clostridia bacterium]|jgi:chemotaxis protein methyltransferase CheR|nr:chemotaxis protein CheR [Clostridia bacterium]
MKINLYNDSRDICHVTVIGELESFSEENTFLESIEAVKSKTLHITFLDANILGNRTVECLYQLQKNYTLRLFVLKAYLFSYLYSLGIYSNFVASKSLMENQTEKSCNAEPEEVKLFLQDIKERYGYDYTLYQIESITRRIQACMLKENVRGFKQFRQAILQNEQLFEQLFLYFSVNTTEFFRNPEVFNEIKNKIVPYLSTYPNIKIWCAGCSTGEEPYSLAILLNEMGLLKKTQIYATDINPYVIEEAKNGLYSLKNLEKNIENYRSSGVKGSFMDNFTVKGDYIEINEELKEKILFFQHSLDGNGILNEFHLIMCRNVLIYFTPLLQRKALENFANSLERNGFLVLGKSEGILHNNGYDFFCDFNKAYKLYKKIEE